MVTTNCENEVFFVELQHAPRSIVNIFYTL